ncbi:MAG: Lipid II flippase FtsW [bacterium ADurb.Bin400]|nr:MAG: Lipid II flippase FtsW [bacterium ADurb.Bin400]
MEKALKKHPDYLLSLIVFALVAFGLIAIYSVSKYYSWEVTNEVTDKLFLRKQLVWSVLGLVAWAVFQSFDYRHWQKHSASMFFITIGLISLPIIFGGRHWVNIWGGQFQPSELGKLTFIIYLAGWFASKKENLKEVRKMFPAFLLVMAALCFMMIWQGDLGTLTIYVAIATAIFVAAGSSLSHLFLAGSFSMLMVYLAVKLEPYRLERITTFLNPDQNLLGSGYHIRNALIAVGSGGLWGLGFGQSRQKFLYLPEAHTDSIFAIVAEELGFVRTALILIAFAFIAIRGFKIAANAPDTFSRLLATGITVWITFQAIINVGAMLSMMPLTGVPLPFVSYGGSSMIFLLAAVGILINISKHCKVGR